MSDEAVVVPIKVDDQGSQKLLTFERNLERTADKIKNTGKSVKSSSELFGSLANFAGGTQFGSFAGQIGQLTEKVGQFSEVAKEGAAGALAFKAGIAGGVAILGFEAGKAIGDVVFQTEKWNKELEQAIALSDKLASKALQTFSNRNSMDSADIGLIHDEEEQDKAFNALQERLRKEASIYSDEIEAAKKQQEELETARRKAAASVALKHGPATAVAGYFTKSSTDATDFDATVKKAQSKLDSIDAQIKENELARGRARDDSDKKYLNSLKDQLAMTEALADDASNSVKSQLTFVGPTAAVDSLQEEIRLLEEKKNGLAAIGEIAAKGAFGDAARAEAEGLLLQNTLIQKRMQLEAAEAAQKQAFANQEYAMSLQLSNAKLAFDDDEVKRRAIGIKLGPNAAVDALKEELKLLEQRKGISEIKGKAFAAGTNAEERKAIEDMLVEQALLEKRGQLADAQLDRERQLAELKKSNVDSLEQELTLLLKGDKAAAALALTKQGMGDADAKAFADAQAKLKQVEDLRNTKVGGNTEVQARNSRIMVGRGSRNTDEMGIKRIADLSQMQIAVMKEVKVGIDKLIAKDPISVEPQKP